MMAFLTKVLRAHVTPVTSSSVQAAPRDHDKEREIKAIQSQLAVAIVDTERTGWQVRRALASSALDIVSGDRQ